MKRAKNGQIFSKNTIYTRKVFPELIKDFKARDKKGRKKYGKELKLFDNRWTLIDAYEEVLDLAVYLKKELMEREVKVIAVDIDGVLCQGDCWTPEDCLKAKPIRKMIKKVNQLYKNHFIILYTARRHELYVATIRWLERHGIQYHAISMNKMPAHCYIDDRMIGVDKLV